MARLGALLTAFLITLAAPAAAQERPVLVELYTSQGCSSCPAADAFLHKLAEREDVIALALHVDYWDYIGWKDSFARPEYTARQRAYAKVANRRMVYTPQMIINGADHVVGTRPMDVTDLIRKHHGGAAKVALSVAEHPGRLEIDATAAAGTAGTATVRLFRYIPQETVAIKRGENAGKSVSYSHIVTDMDVVADWDMRQPLDIDVPLNGDLPAVVVIQRNSFGPVEAVAKID
ncbi:hypothetical protein A3731_06810 [Roseovarius sp. HI0049]|nr:hypothetical protein A3731_06810 [Roseovarius sp. HI0049]